MGRTAYLIISDLHDFHKNMDNRIDYPGEVMLVKEKILELGAAYKQKGYDVVAILLGDVNHRSYSNVNKAVLNNNYWIAASKLFSKIYSVLGNHETTYYNSNPFFTLVNEITSLKLQTLHSKVWEPVGIFNIINVVDYFEDGDVTFHFNHYGCPITIPDNSTINIGLFHTDFVFSEIAKASEDTYGMDAFLSKTVSAENNELLDAYDVCFFAHHHKLYGRWEVETNKKHKCAVYHLASLGRPNVTEVQDNFLERNIPVVIVEEGTLVDVENNFIQLPCRADCVREDVVKVQKQSYERTKALQVAKDYSPVADSPVENIKTFCAGDSYLTSIFEDLILYDKDSLSSALETELSSEGVNIW